MENNYTFKRGFYDCCDCCGEQEVEVKINNENVDISFYGRTEESNEIYLINSTEFDIKTFERIVKIYNTNKILKEDE